MIKKLSNYVELLVGVIIVIILCFIVPNFFSYQNFYSIIMQTSILSFFAFGITFPGLLKEFDLSIGATGGLCSTMVLVLMNNFKFGLSEALILAILVSIICGFINGFLVIEIGLSAIIATIGTSFLFNAFELILNNGSRVISPEEVIAISNIDVGYFPFYFILTIVILIILHFLSLRTITGRLIYAVGENKIAAKFTGIFVKMYGYLCFLAAGLFGAIGGIMLVAHTGTAQIAGGDKFLWDAFIAYFVGSSFFRGKRLFIGTFIGCIFIVTVGQILILLSVPYYNIQLIRAIIFVIAIIGSNISLYRSRTI